MIVPEMTELVNWASKQTSISPEDIKQPDKLLMHADVRKLITQELAHMCAPMKVATLDCHYHHHHCSYFTSYFIIVILH